MARVSKRLSARAVATITEPGLHADGDGLYLVVDSRGSKRWSFIFQWQRKRTEMGLGRLSDVSLANAREAVIDARRLVREGVSPIHARKLAQSEREAPEHTFGSFADELVATMESGFRNAKHKAQWKMTLTVYAAPIRNLPLDAIGTHEVLACLTPLWTTKAETASRLRGRIERVLDAAKAKGLRTGENPARWRGHLDKLLPKRQKLTRGHHKALPYPEVPAFAARLRSLSSSSALALEWTILAACRSGETLGARLGEVDRDAKVWTIPADRMKAGRPHRVPITNRMLEILDAVGPLRGDNPYLFPGSSVRRPLSSMALAMQLRRMKVEVTVHGFRSSFRDWVGEETDFASEIAEAALAHVVGDATERAYRRGDALERRRALMEAWGQYVTAGVE
ncbi:MAG: integrase family protein [Devosia sp.]|nr:integrase family protein [Devosia sp.]